MPAVYNSSNTQYTPYIHDPGNSACTLLSKKMKTSSWVPLDRDHLVVIWMGVSLGRGCCVPSEICSHLKCIAWITPKGSLDTFAMIFLGFSQQCAVPAAIWNCSLTLACLHFGLNVLRGVWTFVNPACAQDMGLWLLNTFSMSVTAFTQRP